MSDPSPKPQADGLSRRQRQRRKTETMEEALRWAGMREEDLDQLRDGRERKGKAWLRLTDAVVDGEYPHMASTGEKAEAVRPAMEEGLRFARENNPELQEFVYRYEYFKAVYDAELRDVRTRHGHLPVVEQLKKATDRVLQPDEPVHLKLESDKRVVREERGADPIHVDLMESDEEIIATIRRQAGLIGMGDRTATAYHARKHHMELPAEERGELHPVKAYLDSLERTIREGEVTNVQRFKDGGIKLEFEREVPPDQKRASRNAPQKKQVLYASVLYKKPYEGMTHKHRGAIAPTMYRRAKSTEGDHEPGQS